jgi:enamine deaminase RidA (YjgF/YER057c/UK114 family)
MSKAVCHNGILYLCGMIDPRDTKGATVQEQAREALNQIDKILQANNSDKNHILSALVHLKTMSDFAGFNEVWDNWVEFENAPARTCVESKMITDKILVEVTVTASVK